LNLARAANQFFDTNKESIKNLFSNIDAEYIYNSRFPIAIFYEVVESAVKFKINYLLKPRDTIVSFIYKKEKHKQIDEIKRLLFYFSDYSYLVNSIVQEIDNLQENSISFFKFQELVERIDNEFTASLTVDSFADAIKPFFNYYNINGKNLDETDIPIDFIDIFLFDKKLLPLLNIFKDYCTKENIHSITLISFREFLKENFK